MKKIGEYLKNNIPYVIFMVLVTAALLIYASAMNPGHIYIGETDGCEFRELNPQGGDSGNSDDEDEISENAETASEEKGPDVTEESPAAAEEHVYEASFTSTHDRFWGVTLDVTLSEADEAAHSERTTLEVTSIQKDYEDPDSTDEGTLIRAELYDSDSGEMLADWAFAISEIRPGTNMKLVLGEPMTGMSERNLKLAVTDALSEGHGYTPDSVSCIYSRFAAQKIHMLYYAVILILLVLSVYASFKWEPAKAYLVMGAVLAALWMFALPFGRVPDEQDHFYRIYQISEGHLTAEKQTGDPADTAADVTGTAAAGDSAEADAQDDGSSVYSQAVGGCLPSGIDMNISQHVTTLRDEIDNRGVTLDSGSTVWKEFPNMALYSPVSYLPGLAGVTIGKLFTDRVLVIILIGRLVSAAATICLIYFGLKLLPVKKESLLILALLPMTFQQGISLSADAFINALAIFYACLVIGLAMGETGSSRSTAPLKKRELIILWLCSCMIALCKVVYLPLCILPFMIPEERFGSRTKKLIHCIGQAGAGFILNMIWSSMTDMGASASSEQISYIIHNPFRFMQTVVMTVVHFGQSIAGELLGESMGGLNIPIYVFPMMLLGIYWLFITIVPENGEPRLGTGRRILLGAVWIVIISITFGSMYLGFNDVGGNLITGFQGRYLIPVAMPILFSISSSVMSRRRTDIRRYIYPACMACNLYCMVTVLNHTLW